MEDVLDLYEQPLDPQHPLVCYDEWRRALIGETLVSLPAQPGRRKRIDYEYQRHGVIYLHHTGIIQHSSHFVQSIQINGYEDWIECCRQGEL